VVPTSKMLQDRAESKTALMCETRPTKSSSTQAQAVQKGAGGRPNPEPEPKIGDGGRVKNLIQSSMSPPGTVDR
jgi:hypothetical protein